MSQPSNGKSAAEKGAHKAEEAIDQAADRAAGIVNDLRSRGEALIEKVKDQGSDLWKEAQSRGESAMEDVTTLIRKYPAGAVACGLVAGLLLHAVLSGKKAKKNPSQT